MNNRIISKRMLISIITGSILGIFCIVGASIRSADPISVIYLLSFWYNRLLMGFVIGLAGNQPSLPLRILRGAFVGLLVSFAFYSATEFTDLVGFLAGLIYGIIIELVAYSFNKGSTGNE